MALDSPLKDGGQLIQEIKGPSHLWHWNQMGIGPGSH